MSESAMSIRDTIREADDIAVIPVDVPEWGVKLELRSPTARRRALMLREFSETHPDTGETTVNYTEMQPALLIACSYDPETGEPVFSDADADWLGEKSGKVVERIALECMKITGMTEEAIEEGKDDSSSTPSEGTGSD